MPLDGITLNSVVKELSTSLIGGRVDKIQQPEADEIIVAVRSQGKNHKLLLVANANNPRVHFTDIAKVSPPQAPMFCMLLRKHLGGGRILDIMQPDYERIVEFFIESPNEMGDLSTKRLIIEIMGKHSNIVLVDASGMIMDSIRHVSRAQSSVRELLPGRDYIRPPAQGKVSPLPVDDEYFLSLFNKEENRGKRVQQIIYQSFNGISPVIGSEMCIRANVPPDAFAEVLSVSDQQRLLSVFDAFYKNVDAGKFDRHIYEERTGKRDLSAVDMSLYDGIWNKSEQFESSSKMLEEYYKKQDVTYRLKQKSSDLRKLVAMHFDRCLRKGQIYDQTLLEIENREQLRKYGELITSYIYAIKEGTDRVKVQDFYDEGQEIEIPLDPHMTPSENAQRYFKGYNKAKRTFLALQDQMKANTEDTNYLDSILSCIDTITDESDIDEIRAELAEQGFIKKRAQKGKTKKISKPLHYCSSEGFNIFVGKNNTQNDELTMKFARSGDIWLHTKDIPGSHVIIQCEGKEVTEAVLLEGAMLAAYYSKGRQSGQVPVDYALRKHVRKPKGAKPGFVIYDSHKTLYVTPDEDSLPGIARQTHER